jgi:hypothetical protein
VGAVSLTEPHNEFLELCAVSTSGQLTEEEQKKLQEHLLVCKSCRQTLRQYEAVVDQAIPAIVANQTSKDIEAGPDWSEEQTGQAFFKRLEREHAGDSKKSVKALSPFSGESAWHESVWHHVWMLYAAGILLVVSLSFYSTGRGCNTELTVPSSPRSNQPR